MTRSRGFVLLMFGIVQAACVAVTTDPDMWWHLRTGDIIMNQGLPREDIFSFTVPGREWVTHEWLSQVVMWMIYRVGGLAGLVIAFVLVGLCAFCLAFRTSRAGAVPSAAVMGLGAVATMVISGARPQMFNLVGVALTVFLLERVRHRDATGRSLWWLVPLMVVWANLHSGFLLGFAVIGVYVVGEALARRSGDVQPTFSAAHGRRLMVVGMAAFAATALNPSGIKLWLYPFETLQSSAMRQLIVEWHSPNFHEPRFWPFLLLLLGAAALAATSRPTLRWTQGLLLAGTAAASLQSVRHIPIFAIIAVPIVAPLLADLTKRWNLSRPAAPAPSRPVNVLAGLLMTAMGVALTAVAAPAAIAANNDAIAAAFPVEAVEHLQDTGLAEGRGYNSYHWGGYLIWEGIDVFIDGRADVYGDEFMLAYVQTSRVSPRWEASLDEHDVEWVLIQPNDQLVSVLALSKDWVLDYEDPSAVIYRRSLL